MENLRLTIGPPGTGKTTALCENAAAAIKRFGAESVVICSLTRAAAEVVRKRNLPIGRNQIRTIHSLAWESLGRPQLATAKQNIKAWNELHPHWAIKDQVIPETVEDEMRGSASQQSEHDFRTAEQKYYLMRAKLDAQLNTVGFYNSTSGRFAKAWEKWKSENGLMDYADFIDCAYLDRVRLAVSPSVIYVDEAQDISPAEMRLLLWWGKDCTVVFTGDLDQSIFGFRGATPGVFKNLHISAEHKRVLPMSYRLPQKIRDFALAWIGQNKDRDQVTFSARSGGGEVVDSGVSHFHPEHFVNDLVTDLDSGSTVAVVVSCGYMLDKIINQLRKLGVEYHNPYQRKNGKWNPLSQKGKGMHRVVSSFFVVRDQSCWTLAQMAEWLDVVSAKYLAVKKTDLKQMVSNAGDGFDPSVDQPLDPSDAARLFADPNLFVVAQFAAQQGDPTWLLAHATEHKQPGLEYPCKVMARSIAKEYLPAKDNRRVIVSTIHGIKGGEADVVHVCPDLSKEAWGQSTKHGRDEIIRLFYVAVTRARQKVVLHKPAGKFSIDWSWC